MSPRAPTDRRRTSQRQRVVVQGEKLPERLVLLRWLHAQFGFPPSQEDVAGDSATRQLLDTCRDTREGYSSDGLSYVATVLLARSGRLVTDDELRRYDENVRRHLFAINEGR